MPQLSGTQIWYGKLKSKPKNIPVIYDPRLTPSIRGCIYLYNSERDAIVQYNLDIVQGLLLDVEPKERTELRKSLNNKWLRARREFSKGRSLFSASSKKQARPAPVKEQNFDSSDDDDGDDYDATIEIDTNTNDDDND